MTFKTFSRKRNDIQNYSREELLNESYKLYEKFFKPDFHISIPGDGDEDVRQILSNYYFILFGQHH